MKSIKNILVTTDFSRESEFALEEAALIAKKLNSKLIILNTVKWFEEWGIDYNMPVEIFLAEKEKLMNEAREKLGKKVTELESKYQIKVLADVRFGDAYNEILQEEDEKQIDLVVIAPHEKKSWWDRLFSHLSNRIAKNSHCDTLLVRQH